ncbi:MAG: DUF2079 domain-containing protein [Acidobacteriaceae bacterium]
MATVVQSQEVRTPDSSSKSGAVRSFQNRTLIWTIVLFESTVLAAWLAGAMRYFLQVGSRGAISFGMAVTVLGLSIWLRSPHWLQSLRSEHRYIQPAVWIYLLGLFLPEHVLSQGLESNSHVFPLVLVAIWILIVEVRFPSPYRARVFSFLKRLEANAYRILMVFAGLYFVVTSALAVLKLHEFGYVGQDIAYFMQCLYTGLHGNLFSSNQYQDLLYTTTVHSDFAGHNQPVLFLLLPFYWLAPSIVTLFIVRNALMALCFIPAYKIARMWMHPLPAMLSVMGMMLAPAVLFQAFYDYAPLSMIGLPLLFALQFYLERRYGLFLAMLICCLVVREDLVFVLAGFGVIALLSRRDWRWSVVPIFLSLLWAILTWGVILPHFQAGAVSAVQGCFAYLGSTPQKMIVTVATHPGMILTRKISIYLAQIFTPFGVVVPFVSSVSLISLPYILINVLGDQGCNAAIAFRHYSLIPTLLLFPGAVYLSAWLGRRKSRIRVKSISVGLLIFFAGIGTTVLATGKQELSWWQSAEWHHEAEQVAAMLPAQAAVAVPRYMLPLVANREKVYQSLRLLEYHHPDADYVVLDKNDDRMGVTAQWVPGYVELQKKLNGPGRFAVIYSSSNYLIYKRIGAFLTPERPFTVACITGGCS